jgi:hypothetical protein
MQLRILLLAALAACKPVDAHLPDADMSQHDAGIDAAPNPVTVTVYSFDGTGVVVPGVPVVFVNPDGTAVAHPVTDLQGTASAVVQSGATVTVVFQPQATGYELYTYQAVKPGDHIIVGDMQDQSVAGQFRVSFTAVPNATNYTVYGPCGQTNTTSSPVTLTMTNDCKLDMMEIQVHAFTGNTSLGYVSMSNVPFANGMVTMPSTYSQYITVNALYQGLVGVASVETQRFSPADSRYGTEPQTNNVGGSSVTNSVGGPAAASAAVETWFYQTTGGMQQLFDGLGGSATTYSVDAATTLLPWFGTVSFDLSGKIVVPLDHTGTTSDMPDLFYAQAQFTRMVNANEYITVRWNVAGPTAGDVTLPKLTDDLAFLNPKSTDTADIPQALMFESSAVNGWDDIRPNLFGLLDSSDVLRGTTAKIRVSQSVNPD